MVFRTRSRAPPGALSSAKAPDGARQPPGLLREGQGSPPSPRPPNTPAPPGASDPLLQQKNLRRRKAPPPEGSGVAGRAANDGGGCALHHHRGLPLVNNTASRALHPSCHTGLLRPRLPDSWCPAGREGPRGQNAGQTEAQALPLSRAETSCRQVSCSSSTGGEGFYSNVFHPPSRHHFIEPTPVLPQFLHQHTFTHLDVLPAGLPALGGGRDRDPVWLALLRIPRAWPDVDVYESGKR